MIKEPVKLSIKNGHITHQTKDQTDRDIAKVLPGKEKTAKYIVRAVNCHEALVEALEFLIPLAGRCDVGVYPRKVVVTELP